jgi:hypothetical protein
MLFHIQLFNSISEFVIVNSRMDNYLGCFACGKFPRIDKVQILRTEIHACILALSLSGLTFLGIVLSCRLRVLIPRLGIDLRFRFILVKVLLCICPHSLYLLFYKEEGRGMLMFKPLL